MENRKSEGPVRETAQEARQGLHGRPVLMVLIGGLLLAVVAWGVAEMYGEKADDSATVGQESPSTDQNPPSTNAAPAAGGEPTVNAPVDRDPTPQTGTGGDTQTKNPVETVQ